MTKKRRKSNANGKLEQNEKRVISSLFFFSLFLSMMSVRSVCFARAHNAIQLEHKQCECSAQHTTRLSHHTDTRRHTTHICMWIVEALMQLKSNEDKEWAKELWKEDDIGQNERMRKIVKCMKFLLLFGWFGVGFWLWLASDTMSTLFIWNKARISKTKEKTNSHTHVNGEAVPKILIQCWNVHDIEASTHCTLHRAQADTRAPCTPRQREIRSVSWAVCL